MLEQRDGELLRPLHVRRVPDVGQDDLAVGAAGRGVAVQHRRVCVTIGCGGNASSPGQPGTAPTEPRNARSNTDVSETIWSASPRIHSTGGFSGRSTMPGDVEDGRRHRVEHAAAAGGHPGPGLDRHRVARVVVAPVRVLFMAATNTSSSCGSSGSEPGAT